MAPITLTDAEIANMDTTEFIQTAFMEVNENEPILCEDLDMEEFGEFPGEF